MRNVRFVIVDVFTDRPFAGNQLGVFTDARGVSPEQMQMLALELGFSECVFVLPAEADGDVRIRIFTPARELAFAGHPTLGAAFVLGAPMQLPLVKLETGSGTVPVLLEREGARIVYGRMSQPVPSVEPFERTTELFAALGVERSELPVEVYDNGVRHAFVQLASAEQVAALKPDAAALESFGEIGVSCFAVDGLRVKTRMFMPEVGVLEDAATGSAAGPLAVHLARHGVVPWGEQIEISQGAEISRPSTLYARADGEGGQVRAVDVGGSAVVVAKGEFAM